MATEANVSISSVVVPAAKNGSNFAETKEVKGGFYRKFASYVHVGCMDIGLPWEITDKIPLLQDAVFRTG